MRLKWTDLADADLDKIEVYITEQTSSDAALDVVLKIIDSVQLILLEHPFAGRQGIVPGTRELVVAGLPYLAVYRLRPKLQRIEILRVLHDRQLWPGSD